MTLEELLKLAKAGTSGLLGGAMGFPMDTAVGATNLSRAAYGYGGHKLGLLSAGEMPQPIEPKNVPGTSAHLSGLLGVGDTKGEAIAEFVGGLLSPGPKTAKAPNRSNWTAYHGSPHKFDKFSLDKIGTGEGAQAYGHGLYFADAPEVAGQYKKNLAPDRRANDLNTKMQHVKVGDKSVMDFGVEMNAELIEAARKGPQAALAHIDERLASWKQNAADPSYPFKDYAREKIAGFEALRREASKKGISYDGDGLLYKVDIDDTRAPKDAFLDWDKPLSQQPEKVKHALTDVYRKHGFPLDDAGIPKVFMRDPDGQSLHVYLTSTLGKGNDKKGQAAVTKELQAFGIPGIRYQDQGSRGHQGGTYNTVLFDDSLVKILERR